MKRSSAFILLLFFRVSLGDMCEDICLIMFGNSGCPNGSWCQNSYSCHSLFWTSASRTSVCVFTGGAECQDTIPVLCLEAQEFVAADRETSLRTPIPMISPIDIIYGHRVNADHRPYVRVEYLIQGQGMAFAALFDTATSQSLVPLVDDSPVSTYDRPCFEPLPDIPVRPARTWERYIDHNYAPVVHESFPMNLGSDLTETCRVIRERARLHTALNSTFTFDTNVVLTSSRQPFHFLLGAGKDSDFARAAGLFAYTRNLILIGEAAVFICNNQYFPPVWIPLLDAHEWIIAGSMGFSNDHSHFHHVNYIVDTAAEDGYMVSSRMKNSIVSMLIEQGAQAVTQSLFTNCTLEMVQSLPILEYTYGRRNGYGGGLYFHDSVIPLIYTELRGDNTCLLSLVEDDSSAVSLGHAMLRAFATLFDNNNNRIGFCSTDYR